MSGTIIRVDQLSQAVTEILDQMNEAVIKNVNKAAENAGKNAVQKLKATSPVMKERRKNVSMKYPPGSYAKSWRMKTEKDVLGIEGVTIYNAKHYQIAHLLEFGHINRLTGGRTPGIPHISPVNDEYSRQFVEEVENMKL